MRFKGFEENWIQSDLQSLETNKYKIENSNLFLDAKAIMKQNYLLWNGEIHKNAPGDSIIFIKDGSNCGTYFYSKNSVKIASTCEYLKFLYSNNFFFHLLDKNKKNIRNSLITGNAIPHIYKKNLLSLHFKFSANELEREKISKFLNLLDKQISLLENKLKLTELKMKDFIKKSNVESSKLMIKDIAIVIDGFPFKQTSYVKNGIPIYTISNIGDNKFIDTIEYKYTNIEIDSKYQLNKGDIFASLTGEKGFKSLLYQNENKNYINQRTIKIEIKNNYSPELLQFWCFKNKRKVSLLATGSQKNISKKDVENFLVPKCTKENINLSKIFFNYIENVQLIQNKLHMLNKRKKFYLNNLFI